MSRIRLALIPLFLLIAAAGVFALRNASASVPEAPEALPTATPTATPAPTATTAPTATPTATVEPTATPTPTQTLISLPVTNGTPVPDLPYEVITAENVHRLREVARYGYPRLLDETPYRLTADGKTIVVGTTAGIEFYDARTQAKNGGFEVEFLRAFDMSPDGRFILTRAGDTLTVWRQDGQKVREFALEAGDAWALNAVAISPDGTLLAVQRPRGQVVEPDRVDVYRVEDGSLVDTVRGMGAQFSPDGKYLAAVFDGSLRLYPVAELGTGWEKRLPRETLPWCGGGETCGLTFSPDGTLDAVVRAGRVDVYQVETRKLVRQVSGWEVQDAYTLPSVQFTPQGGQLLITTQPLYNSQGDVRAKAKTILVDVASGEWVVNQDAPEGFAWFDGEKVQTFAWKAEGETGKLFSVEDDGSVRYRPEEECVAIDEHLNCYTLLQSENGWQLLKNKEVAVEFRVPAGYAIGSWLDNGVTILNDFAVISWFMQVKSKYPPRGFAVFDLKNGKQVFSSPGTIARFSVSREFVSIGYVQDNLYHVLLENNGSFKKLSYSDYYFHTLDSNGQKLFLFGVGKVLVMNLLNNSANQIELPVGLYDVNSQAIVSERANLIVDNLYWWKIPGIRFVDLNNFLNAGKSDPVYVLPLLDGGYPFSSFMFSPNGRFFATQADGFIRIWAVVPEDAPVR